MNSLRTFFDRSQHQHISEDSATYCPSLGGGLQSCVLLESSGAGELESCVLRGLERGPRGAKHNKSGIGTYSPCHSFPRAIEEALQAAKETCPGRLRALDKCLLAHGTCDGWGDPCGGAWHYLAVLQAVRHLGSRCLKSWWLCWWC